jgi:hypothetical protein
MAIFIDQMDKSEVAPTEEQIMPYFKPLDIDGNSGVSWAEFEASYSYMDWPANDVTPTQIHIAIASDQLSIVAMWAQNTTSTPIVQFGTSVSYGSTARGTSRSYS